MEEPGPNTDIPIKLNQIRSNLKNWNFYEWVMFWVVIPAFMFVIYALPQGVKDQFFILNTSYPGRIETFLLSSYTHSQLYPHLIGNLAFYFAILLMIFAFESNKRRFRIMAGWSLFIVPIISSSLTIILWSIFGRAVTGQGFSAINGAFLAYAISIFVIWGIGDELVVFDHPEFFTGSRIRYSILKILLIILLGLIVVMGLFSGVFMDAGGSVSNGIAHFGGFITSLIVFLVFDIWTEKRRFFDTLLGISILIGILWYGHYLLNLIRVVKGA
ncbi:MAG: hypothetical protein LUQ32_08460 [Methanomicrobiales archaeon]|nr:hypothetical protein [Methanomicrobiales archaeon]